MQNPPDDVKMLATHLISMSTRMAHVAHHPVNPLHKKVNDKRDVWGII